MVITEPGAVATALT